MTTKSYPTTAYNRLTTGSPDSIKAEFNARNLPSWEVSKLYEESRQHPLFFLPRHPDIGNDYASFHLWPVYIDPTDLTPQQYNNTDPVKGIVMQVLTIRLYASLHTYDRQPKMIWNVKVCYETTSVSNSEHASLLAKSLARIEKRADEIYREWGGTTDPAQSVLRLIKCTGINRAVKPIDSTCNNPYYSVPDYLTIDAHDLPYHISLLTSEITDALTRQDN